MNEISNQNSLTKSKEKLKRILNKENLIVAGFSLGITLLGSEVFAADDKDAFLAVYNKVSGWTTGSLGKMVTILSLSMAALGGVLGFPFRYIAGAFGVGLIMSMSSSVVGMLF